MGKRKPVGIGLGRNLPSVQAKTWIEIEEAARRLDFRPPPPRWAVTPRGRKISEVYRQWTAAALHALASADWWAEQPAIVSARAKTRREWLKETARSWMRAMVRRWQEELPELAMDAQARRHERTGAGRRERIARAAPGFACSRCGEVEAPARYADIRQAVALVEARLCWSCQEWGAWMDAATENPGAASIRGGILYLGGYKVGIIPASYLPSEQAGHEGEGNPAPGGSVRDGGDGV